MLKWSVVILLLLGTPVNCRHQTNHHHDDHRGGYHDNDMSNSDDFDEDKYTLTLHNNGPITQGANLTFFARIAHETGAVTELDGFQFEYWWKDHRNKWEKQYANFQANFSKKYELESDVGEHNMIVQVRELLPIIGVVYGRVVVTGTMKYVITETINGDITFTQENVTLHKKWTFATNNSIEFTADIYDPSGYFRDAIMFYKWDFGNNITRHDRKSSISYSYKKAGFYTVSVQIQAIVPTKNNETDDVRTGQFSETIELMDPVENLTVIGPQETTVGHQQNYTVLCNGSLPINMCWYFSTDNCQITLNGTISDLCHDVILGERCELTLVNYFNSSGHHCLSVVATNDVGYNLTLFEVKVNGGPGPPTPAVTASISALVGLTTVGAIIVIIFSSYQIVRARRMRNVEVADFDFMKTKSSEMSSLTSSSSMSLTSSASPPSWFSRSREKERGPLMNEYKTNAVKYESFREIL